MMRLRSFPEIGRVKLIRHFTLTDADEAFLRKFRNVLGAGVQLCALPWLGYVPNDEVLAHIWPTHHENVHFYGTHSVDGELAQLDADGYRPLRPTVVPPLD